MAEEATNKLDKRERKNSRQVGCFGKICCKGNKIVRVEPADKCNQCDHVTSLAVNIPKNIAPVSIVHSALTDQHATSTPNTNPVSKPATRGVKMFVNKNNNNDEEGKTGSKMGNTKEVKGRAVRERRSAIASNEQQAAPSTDVFYNGLIVATGEASFGGLVPGRGAAGQAGGQPYHLPHLTTTSGVFQRRRRDQEEILHELQREGIVADPRVAVGGVAYELPVTHRRGRQSSFHLESDAIGLLRREREKEKRRLLELKIKMCRAQERRDLAELSKLERLLENQDRLRQVREKMEYNEDLKVRQTNINIIQKLTKGATNRETRDREKRWKMETRRRHREQIRMTRKIKGTGKHRKH